MFHNISFKWCFNEHEVKMGQNGPKWVKMGENVTKMTNYRDN